MANFETKEVDFTPFVDGQIAALPLDSAGRNSKKMRVCIASPDFVGPVRNGGVGTAFTALGEALAAAGHQVTLLFLGGQWCENLTIEHWIKYYRNKGIEFVPMPAPKGIRVDAYWAIQKAYEAYLWLKNREFDIVHFSEWCGPGFYAMLAKRQGLFFQNTTFCVHTHGPTLWHKLSNGEYLDNPMDLEMDYLERQSVEMADVLVSPSLYLLNWMKERKWRLPKNIYLQQYVMPHSARPLTNAEDEKIHVVKEIVFFGRLEERKGLTLFCDAMDRLAGNPKYRDIRLTFLGKLSAINYIPSPDYIADRSKKWPWKYQIIHDKDQPGAIDYLRGQACMAVMPSLADNLPNTVLECLGARIPFLASNAGGIPEMIAAEDVERVTFRLRADEFAEKIEIALEKGLRPAKPAVDIQDNERAWGLWHDLGLPGILPGAEKKAHAIDEKSPLVSVIIPTFNRAERLANAIQSVEAQDYPNYEVIVVDDGSTKVEAVTFLKSLEEVFAQRDWKIIHQKNSYPGAARNNGAKNANGEYLFFMDDDNLAKPEELSTFMRVAKRTAADILTCVSDIYAPDQRPQDEPPAMRTRWLFLGAAAVVGINRNCFGDMNSLMKREVFWKIGGFTEDYGVGYEDYEFFAKAVLQGASLEVIPEALFWYLKTNSGVNTSTSLHANNMRAVRPYVEMLPPPLRNLALYAQGLSLKNRFLTGELERIKEKNERTKDIDALLVSGQLLLEAGEFDAALKLYELSVEITKQKRDPFAAAASLFGRGKALLGLNQSEFAFESCQGALKLAEKTNDVRLISEIHTTLQHISLKTGKKEPVIGAYESAKVTFDKILSADDLIAALKGFEHEFSPELVKIVQENISAAQSEGESDLVDGLKDLAGYIQSVLDRVQPKAGPPPEPQSPSGHARKRH
jgi:O-antigen biosynthesis protein